jgi:sugar phosphate isomerase/epimerase
MKLGVFTVLFHELSFEEMLDKVAASGLQAVEIGTGANPGNSHCPVDELLESAQEREVYLKKITDRGLTISAFSCHGNPISPQLTWAKGSDEALRKSIRLASLMGVPVVNCFSGTAGDGENATLPNWPVVAWPNEFGDIYRWQWEHKLIPYWKEMGAYAKEHNVKIAIELHGGFMVHSPYTMLKLREATCDAIGANLDPSHLWWQGIDPVAAIKILGEAGAIHHFHAKDTYMDADNINMHGVLDMQSYADVKNRAWYFRSVGCGHSLLEWANIMAALRRYDYDYVISIEHEDALMSVEEGFMRAVTNLKSVLFNDPIGETWWT